MLITRTAARRFNPTSILRQHVGGERQGIRKPTIDAPGRMQAAVQMDHIPAAGALMKVINILGDDSLPVAIDLALHGYTTEAGDILAVY